MLKRELGNDDDANNKSATCRRTRHLQQNAPPAAERATCSRTRHLQQSAPPFCNAWLTRISRMSESCETPDGTIFHHRCLLDFSLFSLRSAPSFYTFHASS
ncbi:hypothetical protein BV898_05943 [Hypsibius exemplaris]|uniref:Uncharacterized protein n=1 Tax=Hypsibius exemplaris TaxID=2072580 RepID=A0A1W0WY69_HYPEX|nr:hypothetical protein BV898_05943 [Hypsibius exemplaris]